MIPMTRFLRLALLADAAASGTTGLAMAAAPAAIGSLTNLPPALLLGAGLVFLPYAAFCVWLAGRGAVARPLLWVLVAGNLAIAAECALLPLFGFVTPNGLGIALLTVLAIAVAVFAEFYLLALRRAATAVAR